jgi:hypothetical protein
VAQRSGMRVCRVRRIVSIFCSLGTKSLSIDRPRLDFSRALFLVLLCRLLRLAF